MSRLEAAAAVSRLSGSSGRGLDEVGAFRRGWARTDVDRPRRTHSPFKGGHGIPKPLQGPLPGSPECEDCLNWLLPA
jgi:hypothetical protein